MPNPRQDQVGNRLLSLMTGDEFARLQPHLEFARLPRGKVLVECDSVIEHGFFPDSGIGSIIATSTEGLEVEAGLFGRDGMAPASLLLYPERSVNKILMQVSDDAWRIAKMPLLAAVDESATLRKFLLRYVQTLSIQTSCTALCNAVHPIDERLARWILMCDDRTAGSEMALTHEFLSVMLAVRRPSVTTALHVLEGNGFIRAERGRLIVRNRKALEEFAADAYGRPEAAFRELIGAMA